ncbi:MAG: hypothetical protein WCQ21_28680 [Verrucomicrobiota bacterium]
MAQNWSESQYVEQLTEAGELRAWINEPAGAALKMGGTITMKSHTAGSNPCGVVQPCGARSTSPRWLSKAAVVRLSIAALPALAAVVWASALFFNHSSDFLQKGGGLEFVMTRHTNREAPANATLKQRLVVAYVNLLDRMRKKNPATALYVPSPIHACSVHAMLDECAELSGKRYLIAREALVVVYFGHTKTLNGAQWVAAFERALRDNGMLVLSNRGRAIKVVPKTKLDEYRKAGLVSDEDHPM